MRAKLSERIWSKVDKSGDCWVWEGASRTNGYGAIRVNGRLEQVHRVVYVLERGAIPEGMFVCHHCDNPPCVNPSHLFLGNRKDNARDSFMKGRTRRGESCGRAKLTEKDVYEIRRLASLGIPQAMIFKMWRMDQSYISKLIRRLYWKHI